MMKKLLSCFAALLLFVSPVLAQQQGGAGGGSGSGITQLNTDVSAGPGSGNVAATVNTFGGGKPIEQAWWLFNYQSGSWYGPAFVTAAASSVGATGRQECGPFALFQSITIQALGIFIGTAGTSNIQLAIYATGTNLFPTGLPLVSTGNILDTSTGNVSGTVTAATLTPGIYWGCIAVNDATVKWMSNSQSTSFLSSMAGGTQAQMFNAVNQLSEGMYFGGTTFGTWANLSGATPTFATGTNYSPVIQMQEQ